MRPSLICYFLQNPHFTGCVEFIFPGFTIEDIALVFHRGAFRNSPKLHTKGLLVCKQELHKSKHAHQLLMTMPLIPVNLLEEGGSSFRGICSNGLGIH